MTRDEIREWIEYHCNAIGEVAAAIGTDLQRNDEGVLTDTSDVGIAVRELQRIESALSRLSFKLYTEGIEPAPPAKP